MARTPEKANRPASKKARKPPKTRPASKAAAPAPAAAPPVPVVGIGASAGGLEAITDLLHFLPEATGMAFVIVQHLDPKHASMLPELLSKRTALPVRQVRTGMAVERDHVYVIPPNVRMSIEGGKLRLSPRDHNDRLHMPIDFFFRSLARDCKENAIGVVLSGTASDGTLGLEAIKAEGGITFAQDEASAKFPIMPRNAVASGCVDLVLNPEQIAKQLARAKSHPYLAARPEPAEAPPKALQDGAKGIFQLLRAATGVDFSLYKPGTVRRRIERQMLLKQVASVPKYYQLLKESPHELEALYQDLLIKVTEFFREPESFEALKKKVFPAIVQARRGDAPIRIWVPGCSTGEEVYSIAITLLEVLRDMVMNTPIQIFGTDLREQSIEKARRGVYSAEAVRPNISPERLRRFFTEVEQGYQVSAAVRDLCIFARQNFTEDPPFSRLDLVSCRNVMIYMGPVLQNRAIEVFYYALKPSGFLMVGSSESLGSHSALFAPFGKRGRIFSKKNTGARNAAYTPRPPSALKTDGPAAAARGDAGWNVEEVRKEADRLVLAKFSPAGVVVHEDGAILQFRGQTGNYLEPAPGEASLNIFKMAREGLKLELRAALLACARKRLPVVKQGLQVQSNGDLRVVDLRVVPLPKQPPRDRYFLVLFEEPARPAGPKPASGKAAPAGKAGAVAGLKRELLTTRQYLQAIIEEREAANEELKSANEEIQSSNEEMQSANEELETSKEELQSANEELITVNDELQNRNAELGQLNNDLVNLLAGVSIPIVMLSQDLRIRRYTPMAEKILNLIPTDVGRPMADIKPNLDIPGLDDLFAEVLRTLEVREREVRDANGVWYQIRIRPYKTVDNKIDGVVLALVEIDALKRSLEQSREARDFAEAIVETVQDSLVVLDAGLCVKSANRAFYQTFRIPREETEGKHVYDLDHSDWNFPELRNLLDEVAAKGMRIQDIEVERDFNRFGRRTLLLNARPFHSAGSERRLILLAISDITHRKLAVEARYRRLFEAAPDGILVVDAETGRITDINPYTVDWLGYKRNEVLGKRFWTTPAFDNSEAGELAFREIKEKGSCRYEGVGLETLDGARVDAEVIGNIYDEGEKKVIQFNIRDATERRKKDEQIRASLKEKEVLLQEIHHRVKNNLQVITSLLSLQSRYIEDGQALRMFNETRNRVKSIAVVHELLYQRDGAASVDLGTYVRKLANNLFDSYGASPEDIQMKIQVGNVSLPLEKAVPCGLIVNELLSNALKHAFPDGRKGEIAICLRLEAGEYILSVKDDGKGFDGNAFDEAPGLEDSGTLGLQLVNILADQLGGRVTVSPAPPAEVLVRFPAGLRRA